MFDKRRNPIDQATPSSPASRISVVAAACLAIGASPLVIASPALAAKTVAGIVNADGTINTGTGFSVSHDGVGQYTLDVPAGKFKKCPAILLTAWGYTSEFPIIEDYDYITCGNLAEVKMQIRVWGRKDGAAQDNAFHFVMIQP
jgi:hypothetical protein